MIRIKFLVFFLLWSLLFPQLSISQNLWEISKDKDGIKVYTQFEKDSEFKSFKAIVTVASSLEKILQVLKNVDNYSNWYGYTKTSKLLKTEQRVQYNYVETKFPWPYSNRDMVYKMSIDTISTKEIKVNLKGLPNYIPEKKGIVRMQKAEGSILLKSSGPNTKVIYEFHSEPGNDVPVWLANKSIDNLPFETLSGLRKKLKEIKK